MMPVNCEGPSFSSPAATARQRGESGGEGRPSSVAVLRRVEGEEAFCSPGFRPFIGRLKFQRIVMEIRASSRRLLQRTGSAVLFLGVASIFGIGSVAFAAVAGSPEQAGASTQQVVTFNKDVAPII